MELLPGHHLCMPTGRMASRLGHTVTCMSAPCWLMLIFIHPHMHIGILQFLCNKYDYQNTYQGFMGLQSIYVADNWCYFTDWWCMQMLQFCTLADSIFGISRWAYLASKHKNSELQTTEIHSSSLTEKRPVAFPAFANEFLIHFAVCNVQHQLCMCWVSTPNEVCKECLWTPFELFNNQQRQWEQTWKIIFMAELWINIFMRALFFLLIFMTP